jgi:hypothetical protein
MSNNITPLQKEFKPAVVSFSSDEKLARSLTAHSYQTTTTAGEKGVNPLSKCTVKDLKVLLKDRGLRVSGSKEELLKRLNFVPNILDSVKSSTEYNSLRKSYDKNENKPTKSEIAYQNFQDNQENVPEDDDSDSDSSKKPVKKRKLKGDIYLKNPYFINQSYVGMLYYPREL